MTGLKKIMALFLFFSLTAVLFAQRNPRLGILPFTGGTEGEGDTLALFFSYAPELTRSFTVIPRISTVEALTQESAFHQSTGLTDVDTIVRLGLPFKVDYVMAGHIRSLGEENLILITVFQTERSRLIAGAYRIYQDVEELQGMIPDMVEQLTKTSKNNAPYYTPRLVILPVMAPPEIDLDEASLLTQILIMEIANSGRYSVQPREGAVQTLMTEQRIKHSVVAEPVNVKSIGRALNVQQVLSSDIRIFDQDKLFIASILNTEDASQRAGSAAAYQSVTDGIELMRKLEASLRLPPGASAPLVITAPPAGEDSVPAGEDSAVPSGEDSALLAGEDSAVPPEEGSAPLAGEASAVPPGEYSAPPAGKASGVPPATGYTPVVLPVGEMVLVTGGGFRMGGRYHDMEHPIREVAVSSFYMGRNEVTQGEWEEIMGNNPSRFKGARLPVERISWYDAIEYCNKRSEKEGLTPAYQRSGDSVDCDFSASGYRLPTEAEWEYAARWGNSADLSLVYEGEPNVNSIGWFTMNSGERPQPVMTKVPNALGLYDMSGNVYEWCWDWYGRYDNDSPQDPSGPASGDFRVIRGGSWTSTENSLRHTGRSGEDPRSGRNYIGLRVVRR